VGAASASASASGRGTRSVCGVAPGARAALPRAPGVRGHAWPP